MRRFLVAAVLALGAGSVVAESPVAAPEVPPPEPPKMLVLTDDFALTEAITIAVAGQLWEVADAENRAALEAQRLEAERQAWYAAERAAAEEAAQAAAAARSNKPAPRVVAPAPAPSYVGDVWAIIDEAAIRHGIDRALFARIAGCESGGNPNARNPSGASGLFQQLAVYWPSRAANAGLAGASVFDPWANAEVSAGMMAAIGTSPWNASRHCWAAW